MHAFRSSALAFLLTLTAAPGTVDAAACVSDPETHCFGDQRFAVELTWQDFTGATGRGQVVPGASGDSGTFWIFEPENWELVTKVLDGCGINGHFWVSLAPMTDIAFALRVTDTTTQNVRTWSNALGARAETVLDVQAFPCETTTSTALPGLPPGSHHGYQIAFEPLPAETQARVDSLQQQAIDRGMLVGRAGADWAELEPQPGVYDREALESSLATVSAEGLLPFVWIPAVDSEGLVVPDDLRDPDEPERWRDGLRFDSPEVLNRYRALLDWAVPLIVEHGGWALAVGNEPEGFLEDSAQAGVAPLVTFVEAARDHVRRLDPRLATTITLTFPSVRDTSPLVAASDAVSVNYYCLNGDLTFRGPLRETVPADLDALVRGSDGKELIIQELGCPSGWTDQPSLIGVDATDSAEFFRLAYAWIANEPSVRATFVFQVVDWSEALAELVYGSLRDLPIDQAFVDRLFEWLETTGMMTFDDGTIKPSWADFLAALPGQRLAAD